MNVNGENHSAQNFDLNQSFSRIPRQQVEDLNQSKVENKNFEEKNRKLKEFFDKFQEDHPFRSRAKAKTAEESQKEAREQYEDLVVRMHDLFNYFGELINSHAETNRQLIEANKETAYYSRINAISSEIRLADLEKAVFANIHPVTQNKEHKDYVVSLEISEHFLKGSLIGPSIDEFRSKLNSSKAKEAQKRGSSKSPAKAKSKSPVRTEKKVIPVQNPEPKKNDANVAKMFEISLFKGALRPRELKPEEFNEDKLKKCKAFFTKHLSTEGGYKEVYQVHKSIEGFQMGIFLNKKLNQFKKSFKPDSIKKMDTFPFIWEMKMNDTQIIFSQKGNIENEKKKLGTFFLKMKSTFVMCVHKNPNDVVGNRGGNKKTTEVPQQNSQTNQSQTFSNNNPHNFSNPFMNDLLTIGKLLLGNFMSQPNQNKSS